MRLFLFLLMCLLFSACASQPVVLHPNHQKPPEPKPKAVRPKKDTPLITNPGPAPDQSTPITVQPKKQNEPVDNITELKKNVSNSAISADLIENKLTLAELEEAAVEKDLISLKPQLLLKIGKVYQRNKDNEKAAEYFRSVTALFPNTLYATQANTLLISIQTATDVDAKVIGAVLPLTGKNASLGQHALNAIRLGLDLNGKTENKFRLALFDSQSNPDSVAKGVEKLVREDKAVAVLGGLTSKEALAIATESELLRIPYIGFSQKAGLTNVGDYVFRNSVTSEMQVDKLVQFAFDKLSAKKFAILFPNDSYGVEFSNIFWDHVLARGGEVTAAQTYDPKETDFSDVIQKMIGTYYTDARSAEYKARQKEIAAAKKAQPVQQGNSRSHWSTENILPPIVDFDVLFVPDSSRALGQILAFMKYNDVTDMNYIGTNIWNSTDLPKRAANEDAGIYFVDAIDVSEGPPVATSFFSDYLTQFNEEPTLVEIQAYEAAKILKDQLSEDSLDREGLANRLRSLGRTQGVTGELRMSSQREIERPLHIMSLESGLIKKIE